MKKLISRIKNKLRTGIEALVFGTLFLIAVFKYGHVFRAEHYRMGVLIESHYTPFGWVLYHGLLVGGIVLLVLGVLCIMDVRSSKTEQTPASDDDVKPLNL